TAGDAGGPGPRGPGPDRRRPAGQPGIRATPANVADRSGWSYSGSEGSSGRHCGVHTTPGSTSSRPLNRAMTSSRVRWVTGVGVLANTARIFAATSGRGSSVVWEIATRLPGANAEV